MTLASGHDATVTVAGPNGRRTIAFAEFPVAYMTPALELNEMLIAISFPQWAPGHGYAFVEFSRRHGDFAITSAAALLEGDAAGKITRASVTLGGMGTAPVRARELEQAITGQTPSGDLFRNACESCRKFEAMDDVHAPASYRQHLAAVLSRRALEKAYARLRGTEPRHGAALTWRLPASILQFSPQSLPRGVPSTRLRGRVREGAYRGIAASSPSPHPSPASGRASRSSSPHLLRTFATDASSWVRRARSR